MPSYKEKLSYLKRQLTDMDKRILITEDEIRLIKAKIEGLEEDNKRLSSKDTSDGYIRNQLAIVCKEIENQLLDKNDFPTNLVNMSDTEIIALTTDLLRDVMNCVRESRTRAETLLGDIIQIKPGKLLKKERQEQLKSESLASLTAALSGSSSRPMSPPSRSVRNESPGSTYLRSRSQSNN